MPIFYNFLIKIEWFTVSNAFLKSIKIDAPILLELILLVIYDCRLNFASLLFNCLRNPNCELFIILCFSKKKDYYFCVKYFFKYFRKLIS